jgi:hypothetical protein
MKGIPNIAKVSLIDISISIFIPVERLAHPQRDGSLEIKVDACRRRMERLVELRHIAPRSGLVQPRA